MASTSHPGRLETFKLYLERHIELDRSEHGPLAAQMLQNLCGCDRSRWEEATSAAISALEGRGRLWDAVLEKVAACEISAGAPTAELCR